MSYTPTEWETADIVTATRMNALETAVGDMNMSYTPNTWSDGDILTAAKMNALEQAVASGGGSSDFSTATVTVNFVSEYNVIGLMGSYVNIEGSNGNNAISFYYSDNYGLPLTSLGTPTQLKIPIYNGYKSNITDIIFEAYNGSMGTNVASSSIVSGSAELNNGYIYVTGDCVINLALQYMD